MNSRTLRSRLRGVKNEAGLTFTGTYGFQMIRRTSIVCLEVLCGILVVLGVLVAGSAWRLSQGPLSIQFLLPYAEDLLQQQDTRFRAELDDLILTWAGWERALDVRALGVRLVEKDAVRPVARIREVSVTLSVRALAEGKIAPTSLKIIRPRIRLIRDESGAFELDMGGLASQAGPQPDTQPDTGTGSNADVLALLLNELSGPAQTGSSLRYLNRVSVIGAALRLEDRQLGINWGARHADITVERALVGLRATFEALAGLTLGFRAEMQSIFCCCKFHFLQVPHFCSTIPKTIATAIIHFENRQGRRLGDTNDGQADIFVSLWRSVAALDIVSLWRLARFQIIFESIFKC